MTPTILLVLVVVVLLAVVGWLLYERRRTDELRTTFGPEYRRAVDETGDRRAAEAELRERKERVAALEIRPLEPADRDRFAKAWRQVQADFVDAPGAAITAADQLIGEVMQARGYPVADFEQRVADVSVDHPDVVEHYRAAHAIAGRRTDVSTSTEDLRQAMVHYRALFDDLLGAPRDPARPTERTADATTASRATDAVATRTTETAPTTVTRTTGTTTAPARARTTETAAPGGEAELTRRAS